LTLPQLEALAKDLALAPFRARQIFSWIHRHGATSTAAMTNLGAELRATLDARGTLAPLEVEADVSSEDGTRKLRLRSSDGACIESVLIPEEGKLTQCLSTQVGCGLGCRFCATATMGLLRNLRAGEIVDQVYRARALAPPTLEARVSNLVFMGMGEPMNNLDAVLQAVEILCSERGMDFSPRRITVSTAGVVPGIEELGRRAPQVGLAVSLNATTDEVRSELMPINRRWPLDVLLDALRRYPLPRRRRITFEYVLLRGVNDTLADARQLPRLLDRIPAKVNLIAYNPARQDMRFRPPEEESVERFAEQLRAKGLPTYVRRSRGRDIAAACGQLVAEAKHRSP
jgi:23S rRNA (adenine2503-C2)-methyltransferase